MATPGTALKLFAQLQKLCAADSDEAAATLLAAEHDAVPAEPRRRRRAKVSGRRKSRKAAKAKQRERLAKVQAGEEDSDEVPAEGVEGGPMDQSDVSDADAAVDADAAADVADAVDAADAVSAGVAGSSGRSMASSKRRRAASPVDDADAAEPRRKRLRATAVADVTGGDVVGAFEAADAVGSMHASSSSRAMPERRRAANVADAVEPEPKRRRAAVDPLDPVLRRLRVHYAAGISGTDHAAGPAPAVGPAPAAVGPRGTAAQAARARETPPLAPVAAATPAQNSAASLDAQEYAMRTCAMLWTVIVPSLGITTGRTDLFKVCHPPLLGFFPFLFFASFNHSTIYFYRHIS